ncbi:SDR family oxidoreductase [uncultured Shimia sp.]|uniref:SDR family oxidoreductase n=1 Tax=uncultured Shimia sp. TaxID=573152 RepID=UPI0025D91B93|nr:SDR family oxidoreductase [uncultured Shimia sp.]
MFDFSGKNVIVSGGTSGINLGIAESFALAGANVFVFSRSASKVALAVDRLRALGAQADGCATDVRDFDAVSSAFSQCTDTFGKLDVVVSGAAGNFPCLAKNLSSNGFRAVMEIDLLGTHHVMHAAYPHLKKPGASVINISSAHSANAMIGQSHVCAAKAGIDQITRSLALEWGPEGIRVNSVLPGPIEGSGGMAKLFPTKELMDAKLASIPMRRLGRNEEIGNLCLYLSSDMGTYITGGTIPCDGGSELNIQPTRYEGYLNEDSPA